MRVMQLCIIVISASLISTCVSVSKPAAPTGAELVVADVKAIAHLLVPQPEKGSPNDACWEWLMGIQQEKNNHLVAAIEWYMDHQCEDGSWPAFNEWQHSKRDELGAVSERAARGIAEVPTETESNARVAATSLGLLIHAIGGVTHQDHYSVDRWKSVSAARALTWLLKAQRDDGSFADLNNSEGIISHALALNAISELLLMSGDDDLKDPGYKATDQLLNIQRRNGGWGESKDGKGDVAITNMVLWALKAARMADLKIEPKQGTDYDLRVAESFIIERARNGRASIAGDLMGAFVTSEFELDQLKELTTTDTFLQQLTSLNSSSAEDIYLSYFYSRQFGYHIGGDYWNHFMQQGLLNGLCRRQRGFTAADYDRYGEFINHEKRRRFHGSALYDEFGSFDSMTSEGLFSSRTVCTGLSTLAMDFYFYRRGS